MGAVSRKVGLSAAGNVRRLAALALAGLAAGCGAETLEAAPAFAHDACRRVDLVAASSGERVVGAEDFAIDRKGRRLFVSAYDRRAVEAAAKSGPKPPAGGLYEIPFDALSGAGPLRAENLAARLPDADDFRPHGLAFADGPEGPRLAAVDRKYVAAKKGWRVAPELAVLEPGPGGWTRVEGARAPLRCSANDLVLEETGDVVVSYDHAGCGWSALAEDVFGAAKAGAYRIRFRDTWRSEIDVAAGARYANGMIEEGGHLYLAETRGGAVRRIGAAEAGAKTKLPGGPDNLTAAPDGRLVAAVHPDLLKIGLHRRWGAERAPSRIVAADPESGEVELLFDDPEGALFSAASVGALIDDRLVAGSITDAGLLVCERT